LYARRNRADQAEKFCLYRIDAAKHMHRFYRLDVQRDLFGQWRVVRK
jgi:predicted DNA-binding WGR domain protein